MVSTHCEKKIRVELSQPEDSAKSMAYDDDAVVVGALFFRHVHFFVAAAYTGEWIITQPWTSFIFKWLKLT